MPRTTSRSPSTPPERRVLQRSPNSPTLASPVTGKIIARSVLDLGSDDIVMGCILPSILKGFGLSCGLLAAVSAGATRCRLPRFNSRRVLEMTAAERVTVFEGVPASSRSMLAAADRYQLDFSSLRVCMSIGASMPADMLSRFEDEFGCTVVRPASPPLWMAWFIAGGIGGEET